MKNDTRRSGVLLHISSLPGDYGCGSFGRSALAFIDLLSDCGFSLWQTLPFCLPDGFGSPYKTVSAFSTNPFFIDLPTLFEEGLLTREELDGARQKTPFAVEFDRLRTERLPLLARAASRADPSLRRAVNAYVDTHPRIAEYCEFAEHHLPPVSGCEDAVFFQRFCEYEFDRQWQSIRTYAKQKGVRIIGDIPIYVDGNSCDALLHPELFLPKEVAGCPPDNFSPDGQLWGNPIYNWDAMAKNGFSWWRDRVSFCFRFFDILRIDHFRAIEAYWSIPADAETAAEGRWVKGPGMPFVHALRSASGVGEIIAEDLGAYTPGLAAFMKQSQLPGMRLMQFGGYNGNPEDEHMPYNYPHRCVAYTGTHDNNTLLGWVYECTPELRRRFFDFCGYEGDDINAGCRAAIRTLFVSSAGTTILPFQDLLLYGKDTRMNTPGTAGGNWTYRATDTAVAAVDRAYFHKLNTVSARLLHG